MPGLPAAEVLRLMPQKRPVRFIDEILELRLITAPFRDEVVIRNEAHHQ